MARFVLVHGAFHGAWCWSRVAAALGGDGHTVQTFDLPGHGDDPTPLEEVTLAKYADRVGEVLADGDDPAILVGHSMGGIVITEAAAHYPESIALLVYVCAFLPGDGQSLIELTQLPEGAGDAVQENMVVEGEPPVARLPAEAIPRIFYGDCDPDEAAWATPQVGPQPVLPFVTPVQLNGGVSLPRAYVKCTHDRCIPPRLQDRMVREQPCEHVDELATDHSPFLSKPTELAVILDRYAADA